MRVAEKCRSEEDLKSMDRRNKITQDMLQPKVERSFSDEEGSSDYLFEFSDNDSDSSDLRWNFRVVFVHLPRFFQMFFAVWICPFCPQSANDGVQTVSRLQGWCRPAVLSYRIQLLASWSASAGADSTQTSSDRGVRQSCRGAALNFLRRPLRRWWW